VEGPQRRDRERDLIHRFEDVHRIAIREQSTVLRGFDLWLPTDDWAKQAGADERFRNDLEVRAHQFRTRADQLDALAKQVAAKA